MTKQFQYTGNHYRPDQVASHLSQLYQQSTRNKQRTTSTTEKQKEIRENPKKSIVSNIDKVTTHRLASTKERLGELHLPNTEEKVNKNERSSPPIQKIPSVDLSKSVVNTSISQVNGNILLEKPKSVKTNKGPQSSTSEGDDQEISGTDTNDTVSESEAENRLKEIHALTHSQFIQRVSVSQTKPKSP